MLTAYKTRPLPEVEFCHSANLDEYNKKNKTSKVNKMGSKEHINALRLWKFVGNPIEEYLQRYLKISSGYRNDLVNILAGGDEKSKHKEGGAFDVNDPVLSAKDLFNLIVSGKIKFQGNNIMNYIDKIILEKDSKGRSWVHIQVTDKPRKQMFKTYLTDGKICYMKVFGAVV